jgi:hypothetical protein
MTRDQDVCVPSTGQPPDTHGRPTISKRPCLAGPTRARSHVVIERPVANVIERPAAGPPARAAPAGACMGEGPRCSWHASMPSSCSHRSNPASACDKAWRPRAAAAPTCHARPRQESGGLGPRAVQLLHAGGRGNRSAFRIRPMSARPDQGAKCQAPDRIRRPCMFARLRCSRRLRLPGPPPR